MTSPLYEFDLANPVQNWSRFLEAMALVLPRGRVSTMDIVHEDHCPGLHQDSITRCTCATVHVVIRLLPL